MIKNILVSQPQPKEKSPYFELEKYGVNVTFRSLINVEKLTPQEFRKQRVSILDYTAIVFTSKHAIRCFFELCAEMRISMPDTMKYFATSEAIALYIQKYAQYRKTYPRYYAQRGVVVIHFVSSLMLFFVLLFYGAAVRTPSNALINGSGNYRVNLLCAIMDAIVMRIGLAVLFGLSLGMKHTGFWLGDALAGYTPFVIFLFFYLSGGWKKNIVDDQ